MLIMTAQNQLCEGFLPYITLDGIINAISTVLTIIGAFFIAFFTSKKQNTLFKKEQSEVSKKIYLRNKAYFNMIENSSRMLLKEKNTKSSDIKLLLSSLNNNLKKVSESEILDHTPSEIDSDINQLISNGSMIYTSFKIVTNLLAEEGIERYEEYLLSEKAKYYEDINDLIKSSEVYYDKLTVSMKNIINYYK